ncbi:NifU family protein [Capnocytophaga canimorsus]|uniref:NifU family protein n=1 Tax=Capnocytophaga canimorsus TaxID=28188 RepID=UPI001EDEF1AB|nr:NifU family protein [Capnocytophaga canimorsus]GJQ05825.1 NifU family protein [Capnocytophaga canimorsus]
MENIELNIQHTNNPTIIKLEASNLLVKGSYEYKNIDQAKDSPLAQQLFYLPFIKTVYISGNFIALERFSIVQWEDVEQEVAQQILAYIRSGKEIVINDAQQKNLPITVYAESTPNPTVMKFVANKKLVNNVYEFKSIDEAKVSPLALALFHFPFVKEVFIDENYISVTKYDIADWNDITMELREFIRNHIAQGKDIISASEVEKRTNEKQEAKTTDAVSQQIMDIIEEYVKPAVASDGGNIHFLSYDAQTHLVQVMLQGACSGCPSSTFTLKNGIETMLRDMLQNPQLKVEAING